MRERRSREERRFCFSDKYRSEVVPKFVASHGNNPRRSARPRQRSTITQQCEEKAVNVKADVSHTSSYSEELLRKTLGTL